MNEENGASAEPVQKSWLVYRISSCRYIYPAVVGGPDSSVLLQLSLYTVDPPNVHTSHTTSNTFSTHLISPPCPCGPVCTCSSHLILSIPPLPHFSVCVCVSHHHNTTDCPLHHSTLVPLTELSLCHSPISTTVPSLPAPPS